MVPRPLSRPHHLVGRLPSNGDLARTRTAASERSRSRVTRHGARDDTRYKSGDISRLQASTHAMACAPSCTRLCSGSVLTLPSCSPPAPTTYARLQPHLPTAELQAPRAARSAKRLVTAREDRREDGLPTVEVAQVVEVVDLRVGDVPSSRPSGGGSSWACRGGWCCTRTAVYLCGPTAAPLSMGA